MNTTSRITAPVNVKTHRVDAPLPMSAIVTDDYVWIEAVVYGQTYAICGPPDVPAMRKEAFAMSLVPHSRFTYYDASVLNRFISRVLPENKPCQ